jgi:toxin ParE1/3/4
MQIDWLESAFLDLHRIRDYIRQFNPVVAQRTVACIEAAAKNLARFPEMGHSGEVPGTRELVIPRLPYFLVYRLKGDHVQILRVLHVKQKWPPAFQ